MRSGTSAAAALLAGACALSAPGCTPIISQTYHSIKGASPRVFMLQPMKGKLDRFDDLRVEEFGNEMEAGVPPVVLAQVETEIKRVVLEQGLFRSVEVVPNGTPAPGDPRVLVLRGVVVDYDPGKVGERILSIAGENFLTARVHFLDGGNGDVLGAGHIAGVLKGDIGRDILDTVKGLAKGVAEVIQDSRERKAGQEEPN